MIKISHFITALLAIFFFIGCSSEVDKAKKDYREALEIFYQLKNQIKLLGDYDKLDESEKKSWKSLTSALPHSIRLNARCLDKLKKLKVSQSEIQKILNYVTSKY